MDVEEQLRRIYRDPSDPGSLGGVDRLLRRAKELNVPNVTRQSVIQFLKGEQAYTYTSQPGGVMYATALTWQELMPSGRPIWLTCRLLHVKTGVRVIF